jgi:GAF domain-containing protein
MRSGGMAEHLTISRNGTKEEIYGEILPQIESVMAGTDDLIANLANIAAILKQAFNFHWSGSTEPRRRVS